MSFEDEVTQQIKYKILDSIKANDLINMPYSERKSIPKEFIEKAWAQVDWDKVLELIRPEFEKRVCNAIIGNMETEIKTDVKNIMSIDGVRQKLRCNVYPEIMKVLNEVKSK
jgi:hypothetical protein